MPAESNHTAHPSLEVQQGMMAETVSLHGPWNLCGFTHGLRDIQAKLSVLAKNAALHWDLRAIDSLDRVGALFLWQAWGKRRPNQLRLRPEHESLFRKLQQSEVLSPAAHWHVLNINRLLASRVSTLFDHVYTGLTLLGQLVLDTGYVIRHPDRIPWRELSATIRSAGARAPSITALVGLLIGVVLSYLSARQLEAYGAQGYIVDVLGITVIRELGPMLAAILVAGRSGSAMTAELGVMRVTHELDTLAALGVSHTVRLVLPKVIALIIVLPLLVVWTCFDETVIHRDINLHLASGEILGLVGGSGSGKTTLLREMIGLQAPSRGSVYVFGKCLSEIGIQERQSLRNRCGVLFQGGALFSALNVFDNVAFPVRELRVLDENLTRGLVNMKLDMVGLTADVAQRMPSQLSGGMVTRVGLARALALDPELLLLDEPTSGLDPISSQDFVELVRSLHQELGFSVVMITHDLHTLADLSDRIAVLADQHLVTVGSLETVLDCDHAFTHQFFHGERGNRVFKNVASI